MPERPHAKTAKTAAAVKKKTRAVKAAPTAAAKKKPAARKVGAPSSQHGGSQDDSIYTDPALRHRLKDQIMAGDKGGRPGQWSARKSQLLAKEYESAGGGYTHKKATGKQKNLQDWTKQDWQTADGAKAVRGRTTTARYLPKAAWEELTPAQKKATDAKKRAGSKTGKQTIPNTPAAKKARKQAE